MSANIDDTVLDFMDRNKAWAEDINRICTDFFPKSASQQQRPKVLWIGCSDSRVPESVLLRGVPGEIFTHRNIANQIHANNINGMSVLTFALLALKVEHVVVAGHSNCGGVAVCLDRQTAEEKACCFRDDEKSDWPPPAPMHLWLEELRALAQSLQPQPDVSGLVNANVQEQVRKLVGLPVVERAWAGDGSEGNLKAVHGWVYDLGTGRVKDLEISVCAPTK